MVAGSNRIGAETFPATCVYGGVGCGLAGFAAGGLVGIALPGGTPPDALDGGTGGTGGTGIPSGNGIPGGSGIPPGNDAPRRVFPTVCI